MKKSLTEILKEISTLTTFDPNAPISPDVSQFLRVNLAANFDRKDKWVSWLLTEVYNRAREQK